MSFIDADQLLAHGVGDYMFQSHWMATEKRSSNVAAAVHAATYSAAFLPLRPSVRSMAIIGISHYAIDRFGLIRFVSWAKNQIGPVTDRSLTSTGYPSDTPQWLSGMLNIVSDNLLHVIINGLALRIRAKK